MYLTSAAVEAPADTNGVLIADFYALLERFLQESQAIRAILFDLAGHDLISVGQANIPQIQALGALIAGTFQSAIALADLINEAPFTTVSFESPQYHIYISLIDQTQYFVVFSQIIGHSGLIRLQIAKYLPEIAQNCRNVFQLPANQALKTVRGAEFQSSITQQIDELFQDVDISAKEES